MKAKSKPNNLSKRRAQILDALKEFQEENGYPPTIREIGDQVSIASPSAVNYHLKLLEEAGYIARESNVSRGIRLLEPMREAATRLRQSADALLRIPILGRIQAGLPLPLFATDFALFDDESVVEVSPSMLPARQAKGDLFALEVQGDSMIDAMVNDGDIVILQPSQQAENGEMVAAWLKDKEETTLKYFYRENGHVRLQPANPSYAPLLVSGDELEIQGKVVMVIRQVNGRPS